MKSFIRKFIPDKLVEVIKGNKYYRISTSLSDNQVYPSICMKATIDSAVFANFRRNKDYLKILEHLSKEEGDLYLNEIEKNYKELLNDIDLFRQNDAWGNPKVYEYKGIGKIAPTTLRYIKVAGDLNKLFGPLDGFSICEIGVGYGGQCRIINSIQAPSSYTLVDIKPALMLTQKYLDNYIINAVLKYKTMNELEVRDYDLLISNYAFTELPRGFQDVYLKKVILNSKKGYITYNDINPASFNSYKRDELLSIIPDSSVMEERPLTDKNNCVIVWGHQS